MAEVNLGNGETFWSPATATNAEFNLANVAGRNYDVNGNLIKAAEYPDGQPDFASGSPNGSSTTPDRVTLFYYDWRDRRVLTKYGAKLDSAGENDTSGEASDAGMQRQIEYCEYDNLGQKTSCEWYDGDGVVVGYTSGVPSRPSPGAQARSDGDGVRRAGPGPPDEDREREPVERQSRGRVGHRHLVRPTR